MYTLQGKTRPTRHVRFPHQSTYARRTLPAGGPHAWQPSRSHRQSWTESLLPKKSAPDTIPNTPADRSVGPYPVPLPSQPMKSGESQTLINSRLLGLPGPYHRQAINTFNTCLWGPTGQSLIDTGGGLQPWRCWLTTYPLPDLPNQLSPLSPSGPARSPI
jgi:hypothetical protein